MSESATSAPADIDRGYVRAVVTFIDILGFKALLRSHDADGVRSIMETLRRFAAGSGRHRPSSEAPIGRRRPPGAFSESISDAVVRVRVLGGDGSDNPLLDEIEDLMRIQIECAARDVLVRGGTTIGRIYCGEDGEGPIFGEALDRAHRIEEQEALHPRIMVDEAAVAELLRDGALWPGGRWPERGCDVAEAYIAIGEDGAGYVNYLNYAVSAFFDDEQDRVAFWENHRDLIQRNARASDARIRRKYIWLSNYHNRYAGALCDRFRSLREAGRDKVPWDPERLLEALRVPGPAFHLP